MVKQAYTRKEIDTMVDAMEFEIDLGPEGNEMRKKMLKLELSPNDEILLADFDDFKLIKKMPFKYGSEGNEV